MCDLRMSTRVEVIEAIPQSASQRQVEREDVLAPHDPARIGEAVAEVEPARRARAVRAAGVEHIGAGPRREVARDRVERRRATPRRSGVHRVGDAHDQENHESESQEAAEPVDPVHQLLIGPYRHR
jgi:hypothetical protein